MSIRKGVLFLAILAQLMPSVAFSADEKNSVDQIVTTESQPIVVDGKCDNPGNNPKCGSDN